jgi:hypothetical protein
MGFNTECKWTIANNYYKEFGIRFKLKSVCLYVNDLTSLFDVSCTVAMLHDWHSQTQENTHKNIENW